MALSEPARGVLAMVGACVVWGFSPLFYDLLAAVDPAEVLAHRTVWSFVIFGAVLAGQGRLGRLTGLLGDWRGAATVALAALFISVNWFLFILSIQIGRVVEASLGYYIFPLVAVVLGLAVFGERLSRLQWQAVAVAGLAVLLLTWGLGAVPWISLTLAATFGMYGVIKKRAGAGPVVSVTAEVLVLLPLAAVWLWGVHVRGWSVIDGRQTAVFGDDPVASVLLVLSGLITATPLILFSYASQRVRLATVGLLQYLNPTLQFFTAVAILGERLTVWHGVTFALIWTALAVYSADGYRADRAARSASKSASGPPTRVK